MRRKIEERLSWQQGHTRRAWPARTLWYGYDAEGHPVSQIAVLVGASSTLSLVLPRDLPAHLGDGGHWETVSDKPILGSRGGSSDGGLVIGLPVDSERLPCDWSFPAIWLGAVGGRLWFVNPWEQDATIVLAVTERGRLAYSEQLTIPSHGGMLWPGVSVGANFRAAGTIPGAMIEIRPMQGSVAAGLAR